MLINLTLSLMYAKLTYLFFIPLAVCLASSCTSEKADNAESGKGPELSFAVSGLTRASVTTSFDEFAVYGDIRRPANDILSPVVLFDKTEVKYNETKGWSYEGTQYWMPECEHSFVAISPSSVLGAGSAPRYLNSQLSFTYTLPTTGGGKLSSNSDVTDIIAATHRRLYDKDEFVKDDEDESVNKDANNKVTFKFSHILSLINLAPALNDNIMKNDEYIQFSKLELSGFKTKADFSILPASRLSNSPTDDMVIDVANLEGTGNLTIEFPEPVKVLNDHRYVSLLDANDAIIMLPQAFADGSEAKITLYYTVNDSSEEKRIILPLNNRGGAWEWGKSYTYRVIIDRKGPSIAETTIKDWEVLDVGDIDVR